MIEIEAIAKTVKTTKGDVATNLASTGYTEVVPNYLNLACHCCPDRKKVVKVKKVIFNNPATIIYWDDKSKTVVKCQNGDTFDKEKGFVMAYLKKMLGNKNEFNKEIHKWVKEEE